jgi:hypothetical protein
MPHDGRLSIPPPRSDNTSSQTCRRSNKSMNCWSTARDFGSENRRYLRISLPSSRSGSDALVEN